MKNPLLLLTLCIMASINSFGQSEQKIGNIFDQVGWGDYCSKKSFFDKDRCKINTNYDEIFISLWSSLERKYKIDVSSSGLLGFLPIYLNFADTDTFKITLGGVQNPITEKIGIYKFDNFNKLLYLRVDNTDYVFGIVYYNYKKTNDYDWENILELYLYEGAKWDTPLVEIEKKGKRLYQRFGKY